MKRVVFILFMLLTIFSNTTTTVYGRSRVIVKSGDDYVSVFSRTNTKYIIKESIDLSGKRINIGAGSILDFRGGSFSNGIIVGNNTRVKAANYEIFKRGFTRYRAYMNQGASDRFPPSVIKEYHDCILIEGTWSNRKCGTKWTGLLNKIKSDEDVMVAVMNYINLHKDGVVVKFPRINALGYEKGVLAGNRVIDFNYSTISYPDDLNVWVDTLIPLPQGAKPCNMESGYGLITVNNNTTVSNLSLDGKSTFRQNEPLKLGVSNLICIGNSQNVRFENVNVSNALGPAMVAHPKSKDITFKNCGFYNIGEHVLYSQQYLGYCHFEGCTFDTWDSERLSVFRNGTNYLYKHTPLLEAGDASYDELYDFDLSFTNCSFNNPKRVNSQGRTLGGFITCDFPIKVTLDHCKFTGSYPKFNPGGDPSISEKSRKANRLIVRNCDGAPYAYQSQANINIITEYYNCVNIPFRTVYAKRYEDCQLFIDVYEDNLENVSSSFINEFKEPLVVKNCVLKDEGRDGIINHPLFHRPILFEKCSFVSISGRNNMDLVSIKKNGLSKVSFISCDIELPGYRLVGGDKELETFTFNNNRIYSVETDCVKATLINVEVSNNQGFDEYGIQQIVQKKINRDYKK